MAFKGRHSLIPAFNVNEYGRRINIFIFVILWLLEITARGLIAFAMNDHVCLRSSVLVIFIQLQMKFVPK